MPGKVIGKALNLGFAGKVSRNVDNIISARIVKSILGGDSAETQPKIAFGDPVVLNADNTYSKFGATGTGVSDPTAANFAGFAVGEVKQVLTYGDAQVGEYATNEACDVLQRGSTTVFLKVGTPTAGGKVYICTAKGDSAYAVGQLFVTATPATLGTGTVVELPNVRFTTGKVDANKITEVSILNRVNP